MIHRAQRRLHDRIECFDINAILISFMKVLLMLFFLSEFEGVNFGPFFFRFIYVETAYLWKWWQRQSEKMQADVKMLINEGRLEIIGGAWSMNDEAVTHYHSIIDQFTWGFRYTLNLM